jgi:uncharacterized protein
VLMKIIDFHSHIDDILHGGDIVEPYSKRAWTPGNIFEVSEYRITGMKGPLAFISHHLEAIYVNHHIQFGTIENMKRSMDEYGVTRTVLLPIAPYTDALQYLKKAGSDKRFIVFASVSPYDPDKEKKLKSQIEAGCVGLKLHPVLQNAPADHPGYFEILEIFRKYQMPVLVHSGIVVYYVAYQPLRYGYGEPLKFEKLIKAFPDIPIVMGHMGIKEAGQVIDLAAKYDNLYADSSNQRLSNLKKAVPVFGKHRLLYGSDWPTSRQMIPIRIGMKLTKDDPEFQEKFFSKNAESLLKAKGV